MDNIQSYSYGKHQFAVPTLNPEGGCHLKPQPSARLSGSIIEEVDKVWNYRAFEKVHLPIEAPEPVDSRSFLIQRNIRILDMPIKLAGSFDEYRIPLEATPFLETIQKIINYEHASFPSGLVKEYYAYLTIDQQQLTSGKMQRAEGAHVDGFQGSRVYPKTKINHTYIVSNQTRTRFLTHKFSIRHLDPVFHNYFADFDRQAKLPENAGQEILTKYYTIYLMNAYCVHEATSANEEGYRTFVRVSYDVKEFDRLGNTLNPMFPELKWKMVPRQIQGALVNFQSLPAEYQNIINTEFYTESFEKIVKSFSSRQLYYNFLYELTRQKKENNLETILQHVKPLINQDIYLARLCWAILLNSPSPIKDKAKRILYAACIHNHACNLHFTDLRNEMISKKLLNPKL